MFRAVLQLVGPNAMNFVLVKMATTALALVLARLQPQFEAVAAWAMIFFGGFLVAQNAMVLIAG